MDWQDLLFSASGRINRGKYWLTFLIYVAVTGVVLLAVIFITGIIPDATTTLISLYIGGGLLYLAVVYSGVVILIKRLHDRDKNGWWLLLFWALPIVLSSNRLIIDNPGISIGFSLVGLAISVWFFVEIACLRGTIGPNRFGPDPLAGNPAR
jgi:uncharacterized membrane protein YhaH (DUF805 family)